MAIAARSMTRLKLDAIASNADERVAAAANLKHQIRQHVAPKNDDRDAHSGGTPLAVRSLIPVAGAIEATLADVRLVLGGHLDKTIAIEFRPIDLEERDEPKYRPEKLCARANSRSRGRASDPRRRARRERRSARASSLRRG